MHGVVPWHAQPRLPLPTEIDETIPAVNVVEEMKYPQAEMHKIIDLYTVFGNKVDSPQSSIGVTGGETHETVCQTILGNNAAESTSQMRCTSQCSVPVTDNSLHNKHCPVIRMFMPNTFYSKSNMSVLHGIISYSDFRSNEPRLWFMAITKIGVRAAGRNLAKMFLGELDNFFMRHTTGADQDHAVSTVVLADIVC